MQLGVKGHAIGCEKLLNLLYLSKNDFKNSKDNLERLSMKPIFVTIACGFISTTTQATWFSQNGAFVNSNASLSILKSNKKIGIINFCIRVWNNDFKS